MKAFLKNIIIAILTWEARAIIKKHKPVIIGVTGSVGKTSMKDAIAGVVATTYSVRASQKSFNSEFGVPLTILGEDTAWGSVTGWIGIIGSGLKTMLMSGRYPEVLVLEVGVDHPGDMERTMRWLPLDIAVVGYIGEKPVHLENFMSVEGLREEKLKILRGLKKDGALILIQDDPSVLAYKNKFSGRVMTFGFQEGATVRGDRYVIHYDAYGAPQGIEANVLVGSSAHPLSYRGIIGKQFVYPVLAACAVAKACGIEIEKALAALVNHSPSAGRMRLLSGIRDSIIIDDTYNSSPVAAREALEALRELRVRGKKRAILGDMKELGRISKEAHREIGELAAEVADTLITVGPEAKTMAEAAKKAGLKDVVSFDASREAAPYVREHIEDGDAILCKGSQSIRMEHVVKTILANHQDARLLVRQGKEWEKR
jgi:UDP-N-acetylmuramoyl-tripeptide--D-alanyl-D-alanine ligase